MCGIAGIIQLSESVEKKDLEKMINLLRHRGPDDNGLFIDENVGLGHVRLSIQDLSTAGRQPFACNANRFHIVFNGEIYNFLELRDELKSDYIFKTKTDTEVILAAYLKWGEECLEKFNGDWAFAIYDSVEKKVFAGRDRYGIKPFYYYHDKNRFIFSSEIKAILPFINVEQNDSLIYDYLVFKRTDHTKDTFFSKVYKLGHGESLVYKGGVLGINRWYNLRDRVKKVERPSLARFRELLKNSIRIRLRSDVPVGVSLSGGIDSSAITSVVAEDLERTDINTFSAVYGKDSGADESEFIDSYRDKLQNMHYTMPDSDSFLGDMEDFVYAQGEPVSTIGPYAQFKVMELAKGKVKVTLDGQGADEQLAGYHYFISTYFIELFKKKKGYQLVKEIFAYLFKQKSLFAFKYLTYYILSNKLKNYANKKTTNFIKPEFMNMWKGNSEVREKLLNPKDLNELLIDHFEFKLEHLLKWDDLNAMYFSIESRVPFLDHNLVEYSLGLDSAWKIRNAETKFILRESVKDILPNKIYSRKDKKGFSTPSDDWFRNTKIIETVYCILKSKSFAQRGYFDVERCLKLYRKHINGDINISREIWQWINLEMWFKKFIDNENIN